MTDVCTCDSTFVCLCVINDNVKSSIAWVETPNASTRTPHENKNATLHIKSRAACGSIRKVEYGPPLGPPARLCAPRARRSLAAPMALPSATRHASSAHTHTERDTHPPPPSPPSDQQHQYHHHHLNEAAPKSDHPPTRHPLALAHDRHDRPRARQSVPIVAHAAPPPAWPSPTLLPPLAWPSPTLLPPLVQVLSASAICNLDTGIRPPTSLATAACSRHTYQHVVEQHGPLAAAAARATRSGSTGHSQRQQHGPLAAAAAAAPFATSGALFAHPGAHSAAAGAFLHSRKGSGGELIRLQLHALADDIH